MKQALHRHSIIFGTFQEVDNIEFFPYCYTRESDCSLALSLPPFLSPSPSPVSLYETRATDKRCAYSLGLRGISRVRKKMKTTKENRASFSEISESRVTRKINGERRREKILADTFYNSIFPNATL